MNFFAIFSHKRFAFLIVHVILFPTTNSTIQFMFLDTAQTISVSVIVGLTKITDFLARTVRGVVLALFADIVIKTSTDVV